MTDPAARTVAPQASASRSAMRRPAWLAAAVAAGVVLACAIASITPDPIGVFWDDGVYLLTAKALAAGEGYRYLHLPGAPPAIHYPPIFPLLLALLLKLTPAFPANVAVLKLLNPVCLAIGVFGTVRFAERHVGLPPLPAAIAVTTCAVTAPVLVLANALLSESLFFAILIGALWLAAETVAHGGARRAAIAGVAVAALTLVRTVGGVLLPAALLVLWLRRRRREAVVFAVCAVAALAPWQFWVWNASVDFPAELRGNYGPYLDWVIGGYRREPSLAWEVAVRNVGVLWRAVEVVFAARLPHAVQWAAASLVFGTLAVGIAALCRRANVLAAFLLAYGGVVVLWPYDPERFAWGIWPLSALVLIAGARAAGAALASRWRHAPRSAAAAVGLLFVGHAAYAVRGLNGGWAGSAQREMTKRLWPLVEWTAIHSTPNDVVASDAHVMIALYTGRTTMPVSMLTPAEYVRDKPLSQSAQEFAALEARYRPSLLVLSQSARGIDAVPMWAQVPHGPSVTPLGPVPAGGAAFALRARP